MLKEAVIDIKQKVVVAALMSVAVNLISLAPVAYMKDIYGPVVNSGSYYTLLMLTLLLIMFLVVDGLIEYARSIVVMQAGRKFNLAICEQLYKETLRKYLVSHTPVARQALQDLKKITDFLQSQTMLALLDMPIAALFLVVLFYINPRIGVASTLTALIIIGLGVLTERKVRLIVKSANQHTVKGNLFIAENVLSAQSIKAMGMTENMRNRWVESQWAGALDMAVATAHQNKGGVYSKFFMLIQGSAVIGIGCWLILEGSMPPDGSLMIVGSIIASRAIQPTMRVINSWKHIDQVIESYDRLKEFLSTEHEAEKMRLPAPVGKLRVENLTGRAPGTKNVILSAINFQIVSGDILAVIGDSGSGKSSLARFLVGAWCPLSGSVRLDGAEIFSWSKNELGDHIGYLPQEIEFIDGTIAENISRFGDVDTNAVRVAAESVGLHEKISTLKDGYETNISEQAYLFSGGEKQRLGLARAIYKNPQLIVLDEPNSNLDKRGEDFLMQTLARLKDGGATIVVITHRKQVLRLANKLLVMQDGKLRIFGPKDKVYEKMGMAQDV